MSVQVAIVGGGGGVGSSAAFNLLLRDEEYDIALIEGRSGMAVSHEMDLQQVIAAGASGSVRIESLDEIVAADVVVMSAAVPLTVNRSRMVYLRDNAAILSEVIEALGDPGAWPGVLMVVTNPVDPLLAWAQKRYGIDRRRIVGYTANDSLRLRTAIGTALGVRTSDVDAWVIGEHGDLCVPLFDRVTVRGEPAELDAAQREAAADFVRGWYIRHVALDSARSSTWTSGHGVARMVAALSGHDGELWPAAVALEGEYGIEDAALTVPVTLGARGVERVHEWELSDAERAAMQRAAESVREAVASL